MQLAQLPQVAKFVTGIYTERARTAWAAKVHGDLFSELMMFPGPTDPYPIYARMRAQGPLLPTRLGNRSTTSYALSREVLRNRRFGAAAGEPVAPTPRDLLDLSLLSLNPPDHTRLRRLAGPAFSPRRMSDYAVLVDAAVHRTLDEAERRGEFELMETVASPLPIAVMTDLLGLPADPVRMRYLGSTLAKALDGVASISQARRLAAAQAELGAVFEQLVADKRRTPGSDLTSVLVSNPEFGTEELVSLVQLLMIAGFETTVNALGTGVRWLLADRRQWQALVDDPDLAEQVTEEVLRYDPPVQATGRIANDDIELAGEVIAKNHSVITLVAAANRDPDVYERPDEFDITRQNPPEHLAFSGGIHYCLGAPLARMELTRTFRALAERFPDLRTTGPVQMRRATILRGPTSVPLAVR